MRRAVSPRRRLSPGPFRPPCHSKSRRRKRDALSCEYNTRISPLSSDGVEEEGGRERKVRRMRCEFAHYKLPSSMAVALSLGVQRTAGESKRLDRGNWK